MYKQNKLIALFVAGSTARTTAQLVNVNKTTASYSFHRLRQLIHDNSEHLQRLDGQIREKVTPNCIVYTDTFKSYNALEVSEVSKVKHFRMNHSDLFAEGKNHRNGIENFWNQAKRHLRKFNIVYRKNILSLFKRM